VKYRASKNPRTKFITGNHTLEAVWIAIPTILLMVIFGWGYWVYRDMVQAPTDAYEIRVVGKQWAWTFLYDSHDPTTGVLYVPINRPVKMVMTSEDVLHSFFIPNFRVKQDVVPGMFTSVWFEAKVPGVHQIFCAEYCGGSHSGMLAKLVALTEEQWKGFTQGATPDPASFPIAGQPGSEKVVVAPPAQATPGSKDAVKTAQSAPERAAASKPLTLAEKGRVVFEQKGCVSCHNPMGNQGAVAPIGPSPKGLFMSMVELQDGSKVKADENYIRESIEKPQAKLVKGYSAVMPTFKGLITEQEMAAVISYIKSLKE
jgi:cytochrome c oxidase subunit 2